MKKILFFAFAICLAVCFVSCSSEKSSSKITEAQWKSAFDIVINRGAVDGKTLFPLSKDISETETETLRSSYGFKMTQHGISENPIYQLVTPTWLIQYTSDLKKIQNGSSSYIPGIIVIRDEENGTYSIMTNENDEWDKNSHTENGYYPDNETAGTNFQAIQDFCVTLKEMYPESTLLSDGKMSVVYTDTVTEEKLNFIVGFDKNMKLNYLGLDDYVVEFEYPNKIEFPGIPKFRVAD